MKEPAGFLPATTQLLSFTYQMPASTKSSTIATFMPTMRLLTLADSLMPTTRRMETATMMSIAGRFTMAPVYDQECVCGSKANGALAIAAGSGSPMSLSRLAT